MSGRLVCPLLGFPNEQIIKGSHYEFYACQPIPDRPDLVIAVWDKDFSDNFHVGLFRTHKFLEEGSLVVGETSVGDLMTADDALQAQGLIFHILANLPTEVTNEGT